MILLSKALNNGGIDWSILGSQNLPETIDKAKSHNNMLILFADPAA